MSSSPPPDCTCDESDSDGIDWDGDNDNGDDSGPNINIGDLLRGCFSEDAIVQVQHRGFTSMKDLQVGDNVLTHLDPDGGEHFQRVYAFGHYHPTVRANFVQIFFKSQTQAQRKPLEVTGNHLLFVHGRSHPIRADSIQLGEALVGKDSSRLIVERIRLVHKNGIYAPLTKDATIIVNDLFTSTYISLHDHAQEYVDSSLLNISQHDLCHLWMTPFRVMCSLSGSFGFCQSYNTDGRVPWVSLGMDLAEWLATLNSGVQAFLLTATVIVLGFLLLLEEIMSLQQSLDSVILLAGILGIIILASVNSTERKKMM